MKEVYLCQFCEQVYEAGSFDLMSCPGCDEYKGLVKTVVEETDAS